jgi:hypothetical protein
MSYEDASVRIMIGGGASEPPVAVVLEAYELFGRQIDFQLRRLVGQWSHAASPLARALSETPGGRTSDG